MDSLGNKVISSIESGKEEIYNNLPKLDEKQVKLVGAIIAMIESKVRKIISNEENFNWKEFGELCDILPSIVDSRNKSDSSVTGIGYDK
ncbi:MAG: hypothetical protein GY828_08405, partial [Candidatus Gracilibacteria bacterium]|nr:hypothetical protein [Candidatus Gracilibacteria bacterium]